MSTDAARPDLPEDRLERLHRRLSGWSVRLKAAGLGDVVGTMLDVAQPLGPLGAQLLWVAQPALGLLMPRDEIDGLARVLDDPAGVIWLRDELLGAQQIGED
jgi:hypothetical protein